MQWLLEMFFHTGIVWTWNKTLNVSKWGAQSARSMSKITLPHLKSSKFICEHQKLLKQGHPIHTWHLKPIKNSSLHETSLTWHLLTSLFCKRSVSYLWNHHCNKMIVFMRRFAVSLPEKTLLSLFIHLL